MFRKAGMLLLLGLVIAGCKPVVEDSDDDDGAGDYESRKAVVRFKRAARLENDFTNALGLPAGTLCRELGLYSCVDLVHPITLGDVEPYSVGVREPMPQTGVTSPLVVERVALSGCRQRADLDLATPASAILWRIPVSAGRIDVDSQAAADSIDTLYERALLRRATPAEIGHHRQLYRDVEAAGGSRPARDWAVLSCFSVLSSMESVFY